MFDYRRLKIPNVAYSFEKVCDLVLRCVLVVYLSAFNCSANNNKIIIIIENAGRSNVFILFGNNPGPFFHCEYFIRKSIKVGGVFGSTEYEGGAFQQ